MSRCSLLAPRPPLPLLLALGAVFHICAAKPSSPEGMSKLEQEEIAFMRSSLKREMENSFTSADGGPGAGGAAQDSATEKENAIRRAYRNIARRYKRNIFSDPDKFEFQMRILNLARDALVNGEAFDTSSEGDEDAEAEAAGPGRELPGSSRTSDEILKQMHGWQEFALEEHVRFDDPEVPYFKGHTQHAFREAFAANWTNYVRTGLAETWPAAANLKLRVELDSTRRDASAAQARELAETERQLARDALSSVVGVIHACGGRFPSMEGPLPRDDDTYEWVELQLKASRNLRSLFAGGAPATGPCMEFATRTARLAVLEINLEALEHLSSEEGDGKGRADVAEEIRSTYAVVAALQAEFTPLQCREMADQKRTALERVWEDYQFGAVVLEAYPSDACGLEGLSSFLDMHMGRNSDLLDKRQEPDKTVLKALRGLLAIQRALLRPASLNTDHWRQAVTDVEEAVWKGTAFPELHEAMGRLMGEVANAGMLPQVLEAVLEHPAVLGGPDGITQRHGREPGDVAPPREVRFAGLNVPGYSLKPVQRYEEKAMNVWGSEEEEEKWDPVKLGLSYIDLTPACDLPIQVAMCFLSAAMWMWRALQLLGDKCGGDAWLEYYIFEDLWSVSPEGKRLAMQFALKRAIFEFVDYASQMADHQLLAGARLAVHRYGYLLLRKVAARFGAEEDAPKMLTQVQRFLNAARLCPLWSPPILMVTDAIFLDILSSRLHQEYLDAIHRAGGMPSRAADRVAVEVLPKMESVYTLYEASLLGAGERTDRTYGRFEVMGALMSASNRHWDEIEASLRPAPLVRDPYGFAAGRRPGWQAAARDAEYVAVRGVSIDMASGKASLLLVRPGEGTSLPLFSLEDAAGLLAIEEQSPVFLMLNPPMEKGADILSYPYHPFQTVHAEPVGLERRAEAALLHVALTLQQVASGTEVGLRAPFPLRPCSEGLCKGLPLEARGRVTPLQGMRGEAWDGAQRLIFECARLPYLQRQSPTGALEVIFGEPGLEVHAGKPLRVLNEEEFKTWSVPKLRGALRSLKGSAPDEELPALEKHELVERLLRAVEAGGLLEDDEESADPIAKFSRRLTHHMQNVTRGWPHLGRIAPLCALRAAGLILRLQLQQMSDAVEAQTAEIRKRATEEAEGARNDQAEGWRNALAMIHTGVLQERGIVDLDPGQCWDESTGRTFGRCCSVGDYAEECWIADDPAELVGGVRGGRSEESRCCGPASRRSNFEPQLVASVAAQLGSASRRQPSAEVLMPAVAAWLEDPAGRNDEGKTFSSGVTDLLVDESTAETVVKNTEDHLKRPVEALTKSLSALKLGEPGRFPEAERETWLPAPPVAASQGRRVLYATVAMAPQLRGMEPGQEDELGMDHETLEEISLEELASLVAERQAEARRAEARGLKQDIVDGLDGDQELGALWEVAEVMRNIDEQTDELERSGAAQGLEASLGAEEDEEGVSCSADGWRELPRADVEAHLAVGLRLRLRQRDAEDVNGDEGVVRTPLLLTGDPGEVVRVWQVDIDGGPAQYHDFSDAGLVVAVPCEPKNNSAPGERNDSGIQIIDDIDEVESEEWADEGRPWPACIEPKVISPSSDGFGIFLNLAALGKTQGCFQDDCTYSDHFASTSPAECASTCRRIGACRWWTFWEEAPVTCWLRSARPPFRREAAAAVSGSSRCVPPDAVSGPAAEPTLFELAIGPTGTPPPGLWEEWDLIGVLEEFGNLTAAEVKRQRPSPRQHGALRVIAFAEAAKRCAETGAGCDMD